MKNKKKGFTLVELIVVLAILAILAAMLVPALTGYIDKANEKKIVATARQYYIAAQTVVSDAYGAGDSIVKIESGNSGAVVTGVSDDARKTKYVSDFTKLAELKSGDTYSFEFDTTGDAAKHDLKKGTVTSGGKTATYVNGNWFVS